MIRTYKLILLTLVSSLTGCSSYKEPITATPAHSVVVPDTDGNYDLDITINVPGHYLPSRSRLFISPTLVVGDSAVKEYEPFVIDASIFRKKTERREVLHGYIDPYATRVVKAKDTSKPQTYNLKETLQIPADINAGKIMAVVSNDGCGRCSGIDTLELASISDPTAIIDRVPLALRQPEFAVHPKEHKGKGEARLQFIVDKWDIVMNLANNRQELTGMLETLQPILADSLATLTSLNIFGSASAEASYQHNIMLANNRAKSARDWIAAQLNMPENVSRIIHIGAAPEGWEPVVQAMVAANDPDSIKVRELMIKYPGPTDDAAEKYIRKLACWPRIRKNYLAKDRKVLYDYAWTIKSFTDDAELIDMYSKRPDAFNEDEFLRVASLAKDDDSQIDVYQTMLRFFPESETARHNLGVLYARNHKPDEAYKWLKPFADTDAAIVALALNRTDEADKIMQGLNDNSAKAKYVRNVIKARRAGTAEPEFISEAE